MDRARPLKLATGVWMALILLFSLLPEAEGGRGGAVWHLVGYGVLAGLWRAWQGAWKAGVLAWSYGAAIELAQLALPALQRTAEAADLVTNGLGVLAGLLAGGLFLRGRITWSGPGAP